MKIKNHLGGMNRKYFLFRCLDSSVCVCKCNKVRGGGRLCKKLKDDIKIKGKGLLEIKMDDIKIK